MGDFYPGGRRMARTGVAGSGGVWGIGVGMLKLVLRGWSEQEIF